jgi:uncharacterized membrane protein
MLGGFHNSLQVLPLLPTYRHNGRPGLRQVIMMSQNRQAARDRLDAAHGYEVNLKVEIEIMALHEKLGRMRTQQIEALLATQRQQLDLLTRLVRERG